ncbi:MAG: hypothetical protein HGA37_16900 [Lentimicrobium sp.]|nr:hypothetical protein [Lentimicrobium sp.]
MKKRTLFLGMAFIALGFASCTDKKIAEAEGTVDAFADYIDSVSKIPVEDASANWPAIEVAYQSKNVDAEMAMGNIKEKEKAQMKIDAAKAQYEALEAEIDAVSEIDSKQQMRNSLFGEGKIGADMNFDWVGKDNILSVYDNFVTTVSDNKDKYTREDWDEIKLMYEALDSRKNTVEKEGLTSADNRKIAALKIKFGPMFKINRIGEKSDEMEKAKE